uniref:Scol-DUF3472 n=1 Tax=Scolopendra viridis TaxID=118503 RepID=A0A4D5RAU0_SCOVI
MQFYPISFRYIFTALIFILLKVCANKADIEENGLKLTPENGKITGPGIGRNKFIKFNGWTDIKVEIFWDIEFSSEGEVDVEFVFANRQHQAGAIMRINLGNKDKNQTIEKPTEFSGGINVTKSMKMGSFKIEQSGKLRFVIRAIKKNHYYIGELHRVILSGPGTVGSKVVDVYPPNADSTHFFYKGSTNAAMLYNELIINKSFPSTYFMAVGFTGGYFGIQENEFNGYKKALFSLWDVVSQERSAEDELAAVEKAGKGVLVKRFGNEGTGYQSMIAFPWDVGEKYHFLVTADDKEKYFIVTAYIYYPKEKQWKLMSSLKRVVSKKLLSGFYSFLEDWEGKWGYVQREASFNPWVRNAKGEWFQPQSATFSRTGTNTNVNGWVQEGRFYMSTGGDTKGSTKYGQQVYRNVSDEFPSVLEDIDNIIKEERYLP